MFSSRASSKIVSQKVDKSTYLRHTIDKNNNTRLFKKKLTPDVVIRDYDESKRFGSGETATYDIDEEDNVSVYICLYLLLSSSSSSSSYRVDLLYLYSYFRIHIHKRLSLLFIDMKK